MATSKPMTDQVYELIYRDVVNNVFNVNQIVSESQLVKRYNYSKAPVREALISLCDKNIMRSIPRAGYQIIQILPDEVKDIMEARKAVELYMIEKSCSSIGDNEISMLCNHDAEVERLDLNQMTIYQQWEKNVEFHLLLASFSRNEYMLRILHGILQDNARAAAQYHIRRGKSIIDHEQSGHKKLIYALASKNINEIKACLIQDIGFLQF
jgi:DNA-binding GntR family transcriptional regulator